MRKVFLLLIIAFFSILLSSCYDTPQPTRIMAGDVYLSPRGLAFQTFSRYDVYAIEITIPKDISITALDFNPSLAKVVRRFTELGQTKTVIALMLPGGMINSQSLLFSFPRALFSQRDIQTTVLRNLPVSPREIEASRAFPELLGDFNNSGMVDQVNFRDFQERYGAKTGDARYQMIYDIGPAANLHGDAWSQLIDTPYPDGQIGLEDFYVLMENMGKHRPGGPKAIIIDKHPHDQHRFAGESASFAVSASGGRPPYTYIWKKDGVRIPGTSGASLLIQNAGVNDAGEYTVEVHDQSFYTLSAKSQPAKLSVSTRLSIQQHPHTQTRREGEILHMSVQVTGGNPPYLFHWYKDGQVLAGEDKREWFKMPVTTLDKGVYAVIVMDSSEPQQSVQSNSAAVMILGMLRIVDQPQNITVDEGGNATFQVSVEGGVKPYSLQWRKNGVDLLGQTGSTLTLVNVKPEDARQYSVLIKDSSNPQQILSSLSAKLTVKTVAPDPTVYTVTAESSPTNGGQVRINQGSWGTERSLSASVGSLITIEAQPNTGFTFDGWYEGNIRVTTNLVYQFSASSNRSLQARFSQILTTEYTITVESSPTNGGQVRINQGSWGTERSLSASVGSLITIEAQPNTGFTFDGWYEGNIRVTTNLVYQFSASSNRSLQARFSQILTTEYTITVESSPTNGGQVRINQGVWGTERSLSASLGSLITIEAQPNTGFTFDGWYEGITRVTTNPMYQFSASSNRSLQARFSQIVTTEYTITVESSPTNGGQVRINQGVWGTERSLSASLGSLITIEAQPNTGFTFDGWYEGITRVTTNLMYQFSASSHRSLQARFSQIVSSEYTITVESSPTNGGQVRINQGSWGTERSRFASEGSLITIEAQPNTGFTFDGWYEGITRVTTNPMYQFTASEDQAFQASFIDEVSISGEWNLELTVDFNNTTLILRESIELTQNGDQVGFEITGPIEIPAFTVGGVTIGPIYLEELKFEGQINMSSLTLKVAFTYLGIRIEIYGDFDLPNAFTGEVVVYDGQNQLFRGTVVGSR